MMIKRGLFIGLFCSLLLNISWASPVAHPDFQANRGETELKATATATWLVFIDVNALHGFYQDVSEGDRFRLDIEPSNGLSLFFNDELLYQNASLDFARYYVGLWLAENPLSDSLRTGLLDW